MTTEAILPYTAKNPEGPPEPHPYVEIISSALKFKEQIFRKLEARLDRGEITLAEFDKDVLVLREI